MNIFGTLEKTVNTPLRKLGYHVRRLKNGGTMDSALERLRARGIEVSTIVDVGASDGRWSRGALEFFPSAKCLLIEADHRFRDGLNEFQGSYPGSKGVLAAAGDAEGQIFLGSRHGDEFSGTVSRYRTDAARRVVPMTTVDREVGRLGMEGPYLLKLDTHGFELPILAGASNVLLSTNAVIMEVYNFKITTESLLFHEMCSEMLSRGFRVADIADPMHRPFDSVLWQLDVVFMRADRDEFSKNSFV